MKCVVNVILFAVAVAATARGDSTVNVVSEGPGWARFENRHEIVAGSALDFSTLGFHHAPAGKYGWLKSADGHAVFERRPDVAARFYGVNLCNDANYLEDGEIVRLTDRLVRLGYNAVRIHHHDEAWARDEDGARARLDRLMADCIRKGIYLMTDLYVSRKVTWRELGIDRDGLADNVKLRMMTTEAGFNCWKRFATDFLTHVNPETGRALKDEPAMPFLVLVNESSPHSGWESASRVEPFRALWPVWLAETRVQFPGAFPGLTDDAFPARGGWWNPSAEANVASSFWTWTLARFSRRARAFLKDELGVKALLATENNGPVLPEISRTRATCGDFVDFHWYVEHASRASRKDRAESGLPIVGVFRNHNALVGGTYGYGNGWAFKRVWGRPVTVSESNTGGPNFNRAAHGLAIGSFAAVQDWTGIWTFALAHGRAKLFDGHVAPPGRFDLALDPLLLASDRMATLLFLRGDVMTPTSAFANAFSTAEMTPSARANLSVTPDWVASDPTLAWRARLGVSFGELPRDVVGCRPGARDVPTGAVPDAGIHVDRTKGDMIVASARFAGAFAGLGERCEAGPLRVQVYGARACVAAASLSDDDLAHAPRILVWHLTDLHGDGFRWGGTVSRQGIGPHMGIVDWGNCTNLLARVGSAIVSLRLTNAADYDVWALDAVGNRCEKIRTQTHDERLDFVAAIRPGSASARFYYEIVKRRK